MAEGIENEQDLLLPAYDQVTVDKRKKQLDYLVIDTLKDAGRSILGAKDQSGGDYRYYFINPSNLSRREYNKRFEELSKLLHRNNSNKIRGYLRDHPEMLDAAKKIHIQPAIPQMFNAVCDLVSALVEDDQFHAAIENFKVRIDHLYALSGGYHLSEPFMIVYPFPGVDIDKLKAVLVDKFKGYLATPDNYIPRFNKREGTVIFSAEGDGYIKALLKRDGLLDYYYDQASNYAFVRPDVQHIPPPLARRLIGLIQNKDD